MALNWQQFEVDALSLCLQCFVMVKRSYFWRVYGLFALFSWQQL